MVALLRDDALMPLQAASEIAGVDYPTAGERFDVVYTYCP